MIIISNNVLVPKIELSNSVFLSKQTSKTKHICKSTQNFVLKAPPTSNSWKHWISKTKSEKVDKEKEANYKGTLKKTIEILFKSISYPKQANYLQTCHLYAPQPPPQEDNPRKKGIFYVCVRSSKTHTGPFSGVKSIWSSNCWAPIRNRKTHALWSEVQKGKTKTKTKTEKEGGGGRAQSILEFYTVQKTAVSMHAASTEVKS